MSELCSNLKAGAFVGCCFSNVTRDACAIAFSKMKNKSHQEHAVRTLLPSLTKKPYVLCPTGRALGTSFADRGFQ